jgi:rare lipoprotein A
MLLAGCTSTATVPAHSTHDIAIEAMPKAEPKSRSGNMDSYVVFGRRYYTKASSRDHVETGQASWYGKKFHGRKTSSGERYDMHRLTAAHKTLPLPSYALVTNLENGRRAVVRINDRGPFVGSRIIDLSYAAAKHLDMVNAGTARVEVRSIDPRDHGMDAKTLLRLASAASQTAPPGRTDDARVYLQVGAFGSRGNAEQLRRRLVSTLEAPVLVKAPLADGVLAPLYKVQVGPLRSASDADALGRRLSALGLDEPLIVTP